MDEDSNSKFRLNSSFNTQLSLTLLKISMLCAISLSTMLNSRIFSSASNIILPNSCTFNHDIHAQGHLLPPWSCCIHTITPQWYLRARVEASNNSIAKHLIHLPNVWPMLGQRRRRLANIGQLLGRCVLIAGNYHQVFSIVFIQIRTVAAIPTWRRTKTYSFS